MTILFPVALDDFENPTPTSNELTLSHAGQHADVNDAVEALEAKVGIDGSLDTDSIDYLLKNSASIDPGHKHTTADLEGVPAIENTADILVGDASGNAEASGYTFPLDANDPDQVINAGIATLTFKTIQVSGQSDVVADTAADTLTLVAGANVTITTNAASDTITIAASGGGGGGSPGGSSGQVQFNNAGSFDGAAGLLYQSGASPNFTAVAQNAAHVPMVAKGAASQTGHLFEAQNSSGTPLFSLDHHGRPIATVDGTTTATPNAGAGTGATATIIGNDANGRVDVVIGTSPTTSADIVTIGFANNYGATPKSVNLTAANNTTFSNNVCVPNSGLSSSGWKIANRNLVAQVAGSTISFYYSVVG